MEQSSPAASLPPNWVHPDLKRHMMEQRHREAGGRIHTLEAYNDSLNTCALETSSGLHSKRHHLASLEQQAQQVRSEIASLEADEAEVKDALNAVVTQLTHHRSGVRQLKSFAGAPNQSYDVLAGEEVASAAEEPFTVNLEPFFAHLLWRPFGWYAPIAPDEAAVKVFLRQFAPLFAWDRVNHTVGMVEINEKPCLMAMDAATCGIPHCRYWHKDQFHQVRSSVLSLECATTAFHPQDQRLDCVAELFATWRTMLRRCRTVVELGSCTSHFLRQIIGFGWHAVLMGRDGHAWQAPVLARARPDVVPGSPVPLPALHELRNEAERQCWRDVVECAQLNIPAAQLFVDTPDAILWRCMIRTTARTPEQRVWLTQRGIEVYPGSPHLQLHHVLALLDSDASPSTCLQACLQAVSALSAQTCAAATIPGDTALAVAATVSRFTAYAIARCALHLANHASPEAGSTGSSSDNGDGLRYAEELLTTVLKNDGREAGLLPTATVNLTLMLISLKQTNSLAHMDILPLGAISDQVFTLTKVARSRPQDGCTQHLNGLLGMLSVLHRDQLAPALVGTLKAAVQLSLERTFSVQLHFVEQIMRKSSVTADLVLAALWSEYVRCTALFDSTAASTRVATELLEACGPHPPCVLTWVLVTHLAACGDAKAQATISHAAAKACAGFEQLFPHVSQETSSAHNEETEATSTELAGDPDPVELAAYHVLRVEGLPDAAARIQYLECVPLTPLLASSDAVSLLLLAQLKLYTTSGDMDAFRRVLGDRLAQLREAHLVWWSPLDVWYADVVGIPHMVSWMVYRSIPALLGASVDSTALFREAVLEVSADLGVLHPLLSR